MSSRFTENTHTQNTGERISEIRKVSKTKTIALFSYRNSIGLDMRTILSFNVANSLNDEKTDLRFGLRLQTICELIRAQNPDIVCIQEVRQCLDETGTTIMYPHDIAAKMASATNLFVAGLFLINPSSITFGRLMLYNPNTVFPLQCWGEWCSPTPFIPSGGSHHRPKKIGVGIQYGLFADVVSREDCILGDKRLFVANVHYPLSFPEKMFTNKYLHIKIPQVSHNVNTIICGDFNSYWTEGLSQVNDLKQSFFDMSGHIETTFTCFPHAKYNGNMYSDKLDHVFTYPSDNFIDNVSVYDTSINLESDHYLIVIKTNL